MRERLVVFPIVLIQPHQAPKPVQPTTQALHCPTPATAPQRPRVLSALPPVAPVRRDQGRAHRSQAGIQGVASVGFVADHPFRHFLDPAGGEGRLGRRDLMRLGTRYHRTHGPAMAVG